jgi:SAM-dependent methyltransferase
MPIKKDLEMSGRDHYASLYKADLAQEAEWLRLTAPEKVNSIEYFLKSNSIAPETMIELGCGTGAVIQECQRRNLCKRYVAIDYSHEAMDYLRNNTKNIQAITCDITSDNFCIDTTFDIVVLSHVLEHLEAPGRFLKSIRQRLDFGHIIIEVPLEDLPIRRIRDSFRDRRMNISGHVQFFTIDTFEKLLIVNGFRIKDSRLYLPILDLKTLRFVSKKNGLSKFQYIMKILTNICFPRLFRHLLKQLYYGHYAVLCNKE